MTRLYRTLAGFAAAWGASVAVAFLVGCAFALFMGNDALSLLRAAAFGNKDALNVFLFVGGTSAIAAGVVAFFAAVFIAWPLHIASRKLQHVTLRLYILAGFGIALAVSGIFLVLQHLIGCFPATGLWLEYVAIIIAGPIATLTFWIVAGPAAVSRKGT